MKDHDEIVDKFWEKMRRADMSHSKLEYGFETRVLAQLRGMRNKGNSLSLLQLAGRFCLVSLCALLLLGIYLPVEVDAFEVNHLAELITGTNDDAANIFTINGDVQ